ncbi:MAG TPA: GIY-YIG nuclease family protein [Hyphomicrobium sp.]|nr:GIY-YIG nuclease family protein [Hyphomicrobium sp.]
MTRAIYVIRSEPGPVKIGITGNVSRRLSYLRTASAVPLHLAYAGETEADVESVERQVHSILAERRMSGEWFNVSAQEAVEAVLQSANDLDIDLSKLEIVKFAGRQATEKSLSLSFRPPSEAKRALEKAAKADRRSVSSLIEIVLTDYLRDNGYLTK